MSTTAKFAQDRRAFHLDLTKRLLVIDQHKFKKGKSKGTVVPAASNADAENSTSRAIANAIAEVLSANTGRKLPAQTSGDEFERIVASFLQSSFAHLIHLRPGKWNIQSLKTRSSAALAQFEQYRHLASIETILKQHPELAIALGNDYQISPDIVITRRQESEDEINRTEQLVDQTVSKSAALRQTNEPSDILHASVSCKWTLRSDRAQNARSEALNLIRNRKGRAPHIVVVTGEPLPSRIESLALGTGDIDCVYHFALYELSDAVKLSKQSEAEEKLGRMIDGGRLKDISDLPLDLAV
jgi:hypothetical protein